MDHMEFAALESAALEPTDWDIWAAQVETIIGHSLDGDQVTDGYSMDYAYDTWNASITAESYAASIINRRTV